MNKASKYAHKLIKIFQDEIACMEIFEGVEQRIMESVLNSTWETLESSLAESEVLSKKIALLDSDRDEYFNLLCRSLKLDSSEHFYGITSKLETEQRDQLNNLYRRLKVVVIDLNNMNLRINAYVSTVTGIMKQALKEIYPNRRGSLYSKSGIIKEADSNPMVLNREL